MFALSYPALPRVAALAVIVAGPLFAAAPARAGGFFEAVQRAFFDREKDVRPAYTALPRSTRRPTERWDLPARRETGFREVNTPRGFSAAPKARRDAASGPAASGSRLLCVRLCDGYVFPLGGHGRSGSDWADPQESCNASCPGATTALYRGGSASEPGGAKSAADGSRYLQLATAFMFRRDRDRPKQCSCQGPDNMSARLSPLSDPTLRRGDVVVAADGTPRVFDGAAARTHVAEEFKPVRGATALSRRAQVEVERITSSSVRVAAAGAAVQIVEVGASEATRSRSAFAPVTAPAGSGASVQAFTVLSGGTASVRQVGGPAIYVIR